MPSGRGIGKGNDTATSVAGSRTLPALGKRLASKVDTPPCGIQAVS
jgi:hypothetical protein